MPSISRVLAFRLLQRWQRSKADPQALAARYIDEKIRPEDAAFARELFFGVIKYSRKLDFFIGAFVQSQNLAPSLRLLLRLGIYQIVHTPNIPHYAVVSDTVELTRKYGHSKETGFINAVLRNFIRYPQKIQFPNPETDPVEYLGVKYSYPDWLVKRYLERFDYDSTVRLLEFCNEPPPLNFFVNKCMTIYSEIEQEMTSEGITFSPIDQFSGYYSCANPHQFLRSATFRAGKVIIGDPSQSLAPSVLNATPGSAVWDVFAAPGGKTAALAMNVGDLGLVVASEINTERIKMLKNNLVRWHLSNVLIYCGDALQFANRGDFRYILADVPCSGTGTLRRNPDLRWNLQEDDLKRLTQRQSQLLMAVSNHLEPEGILVYSTCSIEPEENQQVISAFLAQNQSFCLLGISGFDQFRLDDGLYATLPHRDNADGVFVAVLKRNAS
jgi:16S rRNA (cytosine967-C5)-methyltransferase